MIGFEVSINGKAAFVVASDDPGFVIVNAIRGRKRSDMEIETSLEASGANFGPDVDTVEHLEWRNIPLTPGDEITIRVIEIESSAITPADQQYRFEGTSRAAFQPTSLPKMRRHNRRREQ